MSSASGAGTRSAFQQLRLDTALGLPERSLTLAKIVETRSEDSFQT